MEGRMNRADRRRAWKQARPFINRVEDAEARKKLVELHQDREGCLTYAGRWSNGVEFAVCVDPYGLTWGTKDKDGACDFESCGPDGEVIFGWGGDNMDLIEEVAR